MPNSLITIPPEQSSNDSLLNKLPFISNIFGLLAKNQLSGGPEVDPNTGLITKYNPYKEDSNWAYKMLHPGASNRAEYLNSLLTANQAADNWSTGNSIRQARGIQSGATDEAIRLRDAEALRAGVGFHKFNNDPAPLPSGIDENMAQGYALSNAPAIGNYSNAQNLVTTNEANAPYIKPLADATNKTAIANQNLNKVLADYDAAIAGETDINRRAKLIAERANMMAWHAQMGPDGTIMQTDNAGNIKIHVPSQSMVTKPALDDNGKPLIGPDGKPIQNFSFGKQFSTFNPIAQGSSFKVDEAQQDAYRLTRKLANLFADKQSPSFASILAKEEAAMGLPAGSLTQQNAMASEEAAPITSQYNAADYSPEALARKQRIDAIDTRTKQAAAEKAAKAASPILTNPNATTHINAATEHPKAASTLPPLKERQLEDYSVDELNKLFKGRESVTLRTESGDAFPIKIMRFYTDPDTKLPMVEYDSSIGKQNMLLDSFFKWFPK